MWYQLDCKTNLLPVIQGSKQSCSPRTASSKKGPQPMGKGPRDTTGLSWPEVLCVRAQSDAAKPGHPCRQLFEGEQHGCLSICG